jgi:DNA-directed RNA polymerase subunit RPC12/RpoP
MSIMVNPDQPPLIGIPCPYCGHHEQYNGTHLYDTHEIRCFVCGFIIDDEVRRRLKSVLAAPVDSPANRDSHGT